MSSIPKVIELVISNDLCIGCGLCVYKCPSKALEMHWNDLGFLEPKQVGICKEERNCISVCPFNPYPEEEVKTENELANLYLKDKVSFHPLVGKYHGIYAGYTEEFRLTSSSGGMATFILVDLLEQRIVNHIFSVKESITPNIHYEYCITNTKQELLDASKTRYYPVTLSAVLSEIDKLDGKVAIVGVACFIKAIRLAQYSDKKLKEKIPFLVGIICGGVKSRFFTEYLADKTGVPKDICYKPEFRIKDENSTAVDYSFGCISKRDNQKKTIKMRVVGDMWGTGLFKANACDFCDDVTTELADISLGDAWLEPFIKDGKGTNVIVTRSLLAEKIIKEGIISKKLKLENLPLNRFLSSQQGSFNHRHNGLPYRICSYIKSEHIVPPKRHDIGKSLSIYFKLVQYFRMNIRKKSLYAWKNTENSILFDKKMSNSLFVLKIATTLYHYKRAIFSRDILKKIVSKLKS